MKFQWPWQRHVASDKEIENAIRQVFGKGVGDQKNPDIFRNWLAFFLISAFVGTLPVLAFVAMPEANKEVIVYIIGQLSGMATMVLGFYFTQKAGQEKLDAERTANTGKMADAITATAKASQPTDDKVIREGDNVHIAKTDDEGNIG